MSSTVEIGRKRRGHAPGTPKTGGRVKGTQNKLNADVKAMIIGALNRVGGEQYLAQRAIDCPTAFLALVGRILPMQVTGQNGAPIAMNFQWADATPADSGNLDAPSVHTHALTIDGEAATIEPDHNASIEHDVHASPAGDE